MGGHIKADSEVGIGTVFSFNINTSASKQPTRNYKRNNLADIIKKEF